MGYEPYVLCVMLALAGMWSEQCIKVETKIVLSKGRATDLIVRIRSCASCKVVNSRPALWSSAPQNCKPVKPSQLPTACGTQKTLLPDAMQFCKWHSTCKVPQNSKISLQWTISYHQQELLTTKKQLCVLFILHFVCYFYEPYVPMY